jgi:hypothetical protein
LSKNKSLKEVSEDLSKLNIKLGVSGVRQTINKSFEKIIKEYADIHDQKLDDSQIKNLAKDTEIQKIFIEYLSQHVKH